MSFLRDNGLTITLFAMTSATIVGMAVTGVHAYNHDATLHEGTVLNFVSYLASGHFLSALFENWESEFLQMSAYVCLTAYLYQRGSAESRDPDAASQGDEDPACRASDPAAPWPVRRGGLLRTLYSYSLGIALCALFVLSFVLHLHASVAAANLDAAAHGEAASNAWAHLTNPEFWFECFQNWQSEFLSTLVLVVFSIFLRFRGSPESKAVAAPTWQTGK
ncbi:MULTISPECIES: DUF6766 family protein [unclassified Sinorhizobium]|uniref:DUF6766 family protein n=1 Tax=unclassified Sinorhizobium TaxID=2613772 RepID=UPI0024C33251|nr:MULTISPECIES: DUF6766 family protein [unclassified Sinorhizobium]MDK1374378.1 hypothetical protein [Sinorhizobium sp. 6-70]MDK1478969.1 hypothetical protein [Sinorhizobium sp. 6-117]